MFNYFDVNQNRSLNKSEWLKGVKQLGISNFSNAILLELYDDYDIKRDGRLEFDEFALIFENSQNVMKPQPRLENKFNTIQKEKSFRKDE
jgi:Ca2+-binding EF-hand superfamily protein